MDKIILTLISCFIFWSFPCEKTIEKGSSWIHILYEECLKNQLPCECGKYVQTYSFISIDTSIYSKNYGVTATKYGQMEPYMFNINKIGLNEYEIFNFKQDSIWAKIRIKNDTLYLIENENQSKFIKSKTVNEYSIDHYYKDNIYLLNKALNFRGYPKLEQILNHDSLQCDCNPWVGNGNTNFIYVNKTSLSWVIETIGDSLYISKVIHNEYSDPDDTIETEMTTILKW
jgi:hypothetical protein